MCAFLPFSISVYTHGVNCHLIFYGLLTNAFLAMLTHGFCGGLCPWKVGSGLEICKSEVVDKCLMVSDLWLQPFVKAVESGEKDGFRACKRPCFSLVKMAFGMCKGRLRGSWRRFPVWIAVVNCVTDGRSQCDVLTPLTLRFCFMHCESVNRTCRHC